MSGWSCKYDVNGICERVDGAYCRPGMKGCILQGKVEFRDGVVPAPVWPPDHPRNRPGGGPGRAQTEDSGEDPG
jgi:hypothetical protein